MIAADRLEEGGEPEMRERGQGATAEGEQDQVLISCELMYVAVIYSLATVLLCSGLVCRLVALLCSSLCYTTSHSQRITTINHTLTLLNFTDGSCLHSLTIGHHEVLQAYSSACLSVRSLLLHWSSISYIHHSIGDPRCSNTKTTSRSCKYVSCKFTGISVSIGIATNMRCVPSLSVSQPTPC